MIHPLWTKPSYLKGKMQGLVDKLRLSKEKQELDLSGGVVYSLKRPVEQIGIRK